MYNTEVSVAAALTDLNRKYPVDEKTIEKYCPLSNTVKNRA